MTTSPENTPLTALDICNLALSRLGESPITAIDPNGKLPARLCYMHYHPVRREVLCAHRWSFATTAATLQSSETTVTDIRQQLSHSLPKDCLRVLGVSSRSWTLRGRSIYSPEPSLRVLYIGSHEHGCQGTGSRLLCGGGPEDGGRYSRADAAPAGRGAADAAAGGAHETNPQQHPGAVGAAGDHPRRP